MPVGAAIAGASVVGAAATTSAAKKSAKAVTTAADNSNATQLQIYNQNRSLQQPFVAGGLEAFQRYNSMLGLGQNNALGGTPNVTAPTNALGYDYGSPAVRDVGVSGQPDMRYDLDRTTPLENPKDGPAPSGPAPTGPISPAAGGDQYAPFYASPGYRFRVSEGMNALTGSRASRGALQSGATLKALQAYGQNMASAEYGNYMDQLWRSVTAGSGAANALSGVGTNYANSVSNNNMAAARGQADAYTAGGNAISNVAGDLAGAYAWSRGNNALRSSYAPAPAATTTARPYGPY